MKKKVLFIIDSEMCLAGVPTVIMNLVRNLNDEYIFDIITLSEKKGYFDDEFESFGGKVFRFSVIEYSGMKKLFYPVRFFQIHKQLKNHFKSYTYDIVHSHCGFDDGVILKLAAENKIPVRIAHSHADYSGARKNKILKWSNEFVKKYIQNYANIRVACSQKAGKSLFLNDDFYNILNPVDTEYYKKIPKYEHKGMNLVQIGYFSLNKNQIFSVQLLKKLKESGIDAKLRLIGFEGEENYLEVLKNKIKELEIEDCVEFLAPDTDKSDVFSSADYCLVPSEKEGLSMVSLEAQAASVPCLISSNVSKDADMGAACFLEYNNIEVWAKKAVEGFEIDIEKQTEKLEQISVGNYIEKIKSLYKM